MSDTGHNLRRVAAELTAGSRRYNDGDTAAGAHVLAGLLLEVSVHDPEPDPQTVETFLRVADRILERSVRLH
ncbi:hypothetical protein CYG48_20640 (plasmid) [Neorhizobium sp. SOG26]|uniref:hypothetical protein n=1 Tax=Neorhizobium sp. SOG26 TaxID=2060726 RepID=UPI000E58F6D5|nr:hypothetical protein [Neorhizobium sp. SOG26]AXV18170.1 hypothetical protein CYG48_20640 [Neorhizobium sp. SOG26]